jgi:hypothetical protein
VRGLLGLISDRQPETERVPSPRRGLWRARAGPSSGGRGTLWNPRLRPDCWRERKASGRVHADAARFALSLACRSVWWTVCRYRARQRVSPAAAARSPVLLPTGAFPHAHQYLECGRRVPLGPGPTPRSRGLPSVPRPRPGTRGARHRSAATTAHPGRPCGALALRGRTPPARLRAHHGAASRSAP